jgi:hypothetical protein
MDELRYIPIDEEHEAFLALLDVIASAEEDREMPTVDENAAALVKLKKVERERV